MTSNITATLLAPGKHGAFVRDGFGHLPKQSGSSTSARLYARKLAVKDVFDIAGLRTCAGSPTYLADQPIAHQTATSVRLLLGAGVTWIGKTVTDELTYSLSGINLHYGTPVNPAAPDRLPGGSSSGSAVAVAARHADIGLGTDCGGSIRLPASYCGVWGMRPTHGRISSAGCIALAPSFDTVGWLANNGEDLATTLEVLGHTEVHHQTPGHHCFEFPADILPLLNKEVLTAYVALRTALGTVIQVNDLQSGTLSPLEWANAFRTLQAAEVHQQFGKWFDAHGNSMGQDVQGRFHLAATVTPSAVSAAQKHRVHACDTLYRLLATERMLVIPTVPTIAPRIDASAHEVDDTRSRSQQLLCMAGLAGLPQVTLPWLRLDGAPVGLSVIGGRGRDEDVVSAALHIHALLNAGLKSKG